MVLQRIKCTALSLSDRSEARNGVCRLLARLRLDRRPNGTLRVAEVWLGLASLNVGVCLRGLKLVLPGALLDCVNRRAFRRVDFQNLAVL